MSAVERKVKSKGVLQRFTLKELEAMWIVSHVKKGKIVYLLGEGDRPLLFEEKTRADTWVSEMVLVEELDAKEVMVTPLNMVREGSMWVDYKNT